MPPIQALGFILFITTFFNALLYLALYKAGHIKTWRDKEALVMCLVLELALAVITYLVISMCFTFHYKAVESTQIQTIER